MPVTVNEPALSHLLTGEFGPVAADLRRRAERVTELAAQNASGLFIDIQTGDLDSSIKFEIGRDTQGLFATVGSDAEHRGFNYPAVVTRAGGEPGGWLKDALRNGFS